MSKIRYVCLSDMHFGEEDSLLTNLETASTNTQPLAPSPVLEKLVACLRELILKSNGGPKDKPTLILNGDILELALATTNQAAMAFERFMELAFQSDEENEIGPLFRNEVYYVPGNHDHHLWELARETQYVDFISQPDHPKFLKIPYHTTSLFAGHVTSRFLNALIREHAKLPDVSFLTAYPNFGVKNEEGTKAVVFTHGHFVEPLYYLMSTLKTNMFRDRQEPGNVWDIEAENFAWIDFFWSAMGRSGEIGRDTEALYEKMQYPDALEPVFSDLAANLAEKYDLPGWGDRMEAAFLRAPLNWIAGLLAKRERGTPDKALSDKAEQGLLAYAQGPLAKQLLAEQKGTMPPEVTLVFGHTHKPYSDDEDFRGYPGWVNVYNTGGWVVETVDPEPVHGGAVVLVDEELNAASLRMYNETADAKDYSVSVEEASHAGQPENPLHQKVASLVAANPGPWRAFSAEVARAVAVRARHMRTRLYGRS
ncbi:MAG: metallophosphoesterase [Planctomycetota bacterium]|jgi:predicted phosphodiesterase